MIDDDASRFSIQALLDWKETAESLARRDLFAYSRSGITTLVQPDYIVARWQGLSDLLEHKLHLDLFSGALIQQTPAANTFKVEREQIWHYKKARWLKADEARRLAETRSFLRPEQVDAVSVDRNHFSAMSLVSWRELNEHGIPVPTTFWERVGTCNPEAKIFQYSLFAPAECGGHDTDYDGPLWTEEVFAPSIVGLFLRIGPEILEHYDTLEGVELATQDLLLSRWDEGAESPRLTQIRLNRAASRHGRPLIVPLACLLELGAVGHGTTVEMYEDNDISESLTRSGDALVRPRTIGPYFVPKMLSGPGGSISVDALHTRPIAELSAGLAMGSCPLLWWEENGFWRLFGAVLVGANKRVQETVVPLPPKTTRFRVEEQDDRFCVFDQIDAFDREGGEIPITSNLKVHLGESFTFEVPNGTVSVRFRGWFEV